MIWQLSENFDYIWICSRNDSKYQVWSNISILTDIPSSTLHQLSLLENFNDLKSHLKKVVVSFPDSYNSIFEPQTKKAFHRISRVGEHIKTSNMRGLVDVEQPWQEHYAPSTNINNPPKTVPGIYLHFTRHQAKIYVLTDQSLISKDWGFPSKVLFLCSVYIWRGDSCTRAPPCGGLGWTL